MDEKLLKQVCEILNLDEATVQKNNFEIKGLFAYFCWSPGRGGAQLIINQDGEKLVCGSAWSFEKILAEYLSGKRN